MLSRLSQNIKEHEWAKERRNSLLQRAQEICSLDDDFIWRLIPGPNIPRTGQVNEVVGCPNCGTKIDKYGRHPWLVDILKKPWKVKCPSCGEIFPKNDFEAFYKSGLNESGIFVLEEADRTLLFNTECEDTKDLWVDDTTGYWDKEGNQLRFIGCYGFKLWEWILDSLVTLRDAFLYSNNPIYARKGLIFLDRIADVYPDIDYPYWFKKGFPCSCGRSGYGRLYGCIWEPFIAVKLCTAWDAFRPCIDDDAVLDFLRDRRRQYKLKGNKGTPEDLIENIENNILRHIIADVLRRNIRGNSGMHQYAMTIAAISLDHPQETLEAIEWLFRPEVIGGDDGNTSLGGGLPNILLGKMDRDGMGDEGSTGYNLLWVNMLEEIYRVLSRYGHEKLSYWWMGFKKLNTSRRTQFDMICIDRFIPNIGDTGTTGAPVMKEIKLSNNKKLSGWSTPEQYVRFFYLYKDPELLRMAHYLNGSSYNGLAGKDEVRSENSTSTLARGVYTDEIFETDSEGIIKSLERIIREQGVLVPESKCHNGYGIAILRRGIGDFKRALWIYFGRSYGHGHRDNLNIGLYAFGLDLLPDLGYPESASSWPKRIGWTSHTISHNTVLLDKTRQRPGHTGHMTLFKVSPDVQVIEAKSDVAYPNATLYKRTVCMIDISDEAFYIVDFFRAAGAKDYHYSFHGAEGEVKVQGAKLIPQEKGTYAGPHINYGEPYDGDTTSSTYSGSGFQYLSDVERDTNPEEIVAVDWEIKDTWGLLEEPRDIHLRLTLIQPNGELALANGIPPQRSLSVPDSLKYVLLYREAPKDLGTSFVSVIEPYETKRKIMYISKADLQFTPLDGSKLTFIDGVKIEMEDGTTDYIISSTLPDAHVELKDGIRFSGIFGFCRIKNGKMTKGYLIGGTYIEYGDRSITMEEPKITGKILNFDQDYSDHNRLYVGAKLERSVIGEWIRIFNDGERDACYKIKDITLNEEGTSVDVGDVTFIRGFKDPKNYNDGLVYNFQIGDSFEIVLSKYYDWTDSVVKGEDKNEQ